jgi:iron complex outermembrane receptor protein
MKRILAGGIAAGLTLGITGPVALAQDEETDFGAIEEIVVTATKRDTSLMATPLSVSAFDQDRLTQRGVLNLTDMGSLVPNMQVGYSPSDSGVQVTIRGITSNNFTELGDPTVAIHIDGMYSPRPQGGMALLHDVERVEIMRGPQGTLFGRNSTSGAINIITARPQTDAISGQANLSYGNRDHVNLNGWVNIPLGDKFALRFAGMTDMADSFIDQDKDMFDLAWDTDGDGSFAGPRDVAPDGIPNVDQRRAHEVDASDAYGNSDRWGARAALRFAPNDNFDWMLTYEKFQDNSAGMINLKDCEQAKGTFFECDEPLFHADINVPGKMDMSIETYRSEMIWQITDGLIFEKRIALAEQQRFQQYDQDGGFYADPDHPAYGINRQCCDVGWWDSFDDIMNVYNPNANFFLIRDPYAILDAGFDLYALQPWDDIQLTTRDSDYDSLVAELQLKSSTAKPLQWIAGAFYMKEDNSIIFDVEIPFCCAVIRPLALSFVQPDREVISKALFAQFDYEVNESLNLVFGYRHTWDKKEDKGGSNHETIGYWVNPDMYDPGSTFWHESYDLIGAIDYYSDFYQSDDLTDDMGTLADDFIDRIPGTDNSYSAKWDQGTWKVGFDYLINDNHFVYGYVATGFKAGGFGDQVDVCECGEVIAFDFDPETNTTYEFGYKGSYLDGDLKLLGTIFFSQYQDMQKTLWGIVGVSEQSGRDIGTLITTNIAEAEISGVEFEFDWWNIWKGGHVYGWVTYLNAEITDMPGVEDGWFCFERAYMGLTECADVDPDSGRRLTNYDGNKLPWSPEWSLTFSAEHNWYFSNGLRLSPLVTVHWQSEMFFNDSNFDERPFHSGQKSFKTVDASLRLISEDNQWGLELYSYNLTDEIIRSWSDPGPGYTKASFYPPRSYGIRFRKDW